MAWPFMAWLFFSNDMIVRDEIKQVKTKLYETETRDKALLLATIDLVT